MPGGVSSSKAWALRSPSPRMRSPPARTPTNWPAWPGLKGFAGFPSGTREPDPGTEPPELV
jgi:hypothetical protein